MLTGMSDESTRTVRLVTQWAAVKCNCVPVRKYKDGNDSYAAVVKNEGLLQTMNAGNHLINFVWATEANCNRLYAFYLYATKHHSVLSAATQCGWRRFFLTVSQKVLEFHRNFQELEAAGWDWSRVHPHTKWCPGGPGHEGHSMRVMSQYLETLVKMYRAKPIHYNRVHAELEKHMCPDLAAHVLSYYYNYHARS